MGKQEKQQEQDNFVCLSRLVVRFICLSLRCGYKTLAMKLNKYSVAQSSKSIETLAKEVSYNCNIKSRDTALLLKRQVSATNRSITTKYHSAR